MRVSDDGSPPLSVQDSFTVVVVEPPQIGIEAEDDHVVLRFQTIPGKTYRVLYTEALEDPVLWQALPGGEQVAGGSSLQILDLIGASSQRFYHVQQVD